jgi:predicted transcriptional regulator
MTLQLTPGLEEELKNLAFQSHTSVDELAEQALGSFVAHRRDLSEAVKRGRADIAAGRILSSEEVLARIERGFAAE